MKILLIAATRPEIQPLLERTETMVMIPGVLEHARINELELDILTPGIGVIPLSFYLGKYLADGFYDLAILAGICGSYDAAYPPGTVVHITEERFPETGVITDKGFKTLEDLGLVEPSVFPFDDGVLYNYNFPDLQALKELEEVRGNTISTLLTEGSAIQALLKRAPAEVESMEGAAFFFGCILENIEAIQVRAISNMVGETNRKKWKVKEAVKKLDETLKQILEEIEEEEEKSSSETNMG